MTSPLSTEPEAPSTPEASRAGTLVGGVWDPASRQFDPVRLRAALALRGLNRDRLREQTQLSTGCIGRVIAGKSVTGETVHRILKVLVDVEPLRVSA